MEYSPAKRRKTSLTSSVNSINEKSPHRRRASHDGDGSFSRRASFMSPTKASLARFNPILLPSNGYQNLGEAYRISGYGPEDRRSNTMGGMTQSGRATSAGPILATPTIIPKTNGQRLFPPASRQERTPSKGPRLVVAESARASPPEGTRSGESEAQHGPGTAQKSGADDSCSTSNGSYRGSVKLTALGSYLPSTPTNTATGGATSGMSLGEDGEPNLPSTPIHLGLEKPPEPPKGLLSSSDSKGRKRKGATSAKSSPLKYQARAATVEAPLVQNVVKHSLGPRIYISNAPKPPLTAQEASIISMGANLMRLEEQLRQIEDGLIRQLLASEWDKLDGNATVDIAKRTKEVNSKGARVTRLRQELLQAELANSTCNGPPNQESRTEITTINATQTVPKTPSLTQRLARFLPFSKRSPPPTPKPSPSPRSDISRFLVSKSPDSGGAPFTVSTSDIKLLNNTPGNPILQRQTIQLSSPSRLLIADILITIDTTSQLITQSQVVALSPWAEEEFGSWLRAMPSDTSLAKLGRAFGRYWNSCCERFRCWNDIAREFNDLLVKDELFNGLPSLTDDSNYEQLTPLLGRTECLLTRDAVSLKFIWLASVNDEGEPDSHVSVCPSFPDTWLGTEDGAELAKVGEAFDMLATEKGVAQAIFMMVNLIFLS